MKVDLSKVIEKVPEEIRVRSKEDPDWIEKYYREVQINDKTWEWMILFHKVLRDLIIFQKREEMFPSN